MSEILIPIERKLLNLRRLGSYIFPGFSLVFMGYILLQMILNYPPKSIGILP